MKKRKIKDFKSFEFPGVEKSKFEEWQKAEAAVQKYSIFIIIFLIIGNIVLLPAFGKAIIGPGLFIAVPFLVLVIMSFKKKKAAGITDEMIKKAKNRP